MRFQYIFESDDASEIVVYLSDVNEPPALSGTPPAEHYVEIGRVLAPPAGRPGSWGSKRFGTFEERAWVEGLDFSRGTWVVLEFVAAGKGIAAMSTQGGLHLAATGTDTSASVDGASVQVQCSGYCMDVNRSKGVTSEDILLVLASYGGTAGLDRGDADSRYCLDGVFSDDGYVDCGTIVACGPFMHLEILAVQRTLHGIQRSVHDLISYLMCNDVMFPHFAISAWDMFAKNESPQDLLDMTVDLGMLRSIQNRIWGLSSKYVWFLRETLDKLSFELLLKCLRLEKCPPWRIGR